ncbi:two-component regulator propeller domain-containing protein [Bacteroidota bacterium]
MKDKFTHYKSFGQLNSLNNNAVLCFAEDDNDNIYIGTDGGGINIFNKKERNFKYIQNIPGNISSISGNVITALCIDHNGIIWIGTYLKGLNSYNPKTGNIKRYVHNESDQKSISYNDIWYILEDSKHNLWIGTLGGGLNLFDRKTEEFIHFRHNPDIPNSLNDDYISTLFEDSNEILWIGTENGGVNSYNIEKRIFKAYQREPENPNSLGSNQVRSIYEDSRGNMWIGTEGGGLNLLNYEKDEIITYYETDGLPNNSIFSIIEDGNSNLWISTNKGICRFNHAVVSPLNPDFRNYNLGDGLQSYEFSYNSSLKSKTGEIYFGGINGFNVFHPDSIRDNMNIPSVVLTDFKIYYESAQIGAENSPLEKHISKTEKLEISFKHNVFSFEFTALDMTVPENNKYAYMLEGFDEDWIYIGNNRTATFTNLDPGDYIFHVKASNNDGIWNEEGTSIIVKIKPPYWKTFWFRILLFLLVAGLLYMIYIIRVTTLKQQRQLLKKKVEDRTVELVDLNSVLEERNTKIEEQSAELLKQKQDLLDANLELKESKKEIQLRNEELSKHRNHLEDLIRIRTDELNEAKEKAEEADRLKMAFLSNMSHEIRTPMNAIIGFSSLLKDDAVSDEDKYEFIKQININGESLLVLIDDILDLSKIEANQLQLRNESFNLNSFIDEIYKNWSSLHEKKDKLEIKIKNDLANKDINIYSDKHKIRQILLNLLDNAFKFTEKGYIEFGIELPDDNQVLFYVKDTGIGISKEIVDVVFDRFYKGESQARKLYRGTGLGLAISKRLAELLGGDLWVDSELGKGTTFYLKILINEFNQVDIAVSKTEEKSEISDDFSGKSILIVEDEENNYIFLKAVLKRTNADVIWAPDGKFALNLCKTNDFDLILMDIKMPVMDGYEATKRIKQFKPEQLVVAQTAFARADEEESIRKSGFDDYLSKPIKPDVLINLIRKYLA